MIPHIEEYKALPLNRFSFSTDEYDLAPGDIVAFKEGEAKIIKVTFGGYIAELLAD